MTKIDESFDPAKHTDVPAQRWFDDFKVGERYVLPSRTITDANFAAFQVVSGDNHPIHYDIEFCKARGYPNLLAHGLQVASFAAAGAGRFPHETSESLIAFLDQSSKFLGGVYAGDTVYPALEIVELIPGKTTGVIVMRVSIHNQRRELVMSGEHRYLVRKKK
ncbi:bifunctional aldehyde dehydrogenase/enoyl-CoA hydratase [Variibacter gotjawalensis]|uniref:Bifunctional aldehyde dehydrogenase/enoyl-CoA hydratase n=1 Tax=Variibacter gotjawalensis TaxID=1333996 RepID=A0A0S3PQE7_9BRAD|nr:MaoC family dehydratase [Variibacter gotjawalensis]NIK48392.1 acyl dehydratase [Variibacter gotjawalensis]RZS50259.1 acyl dehydratase [Variibacter gotjawalensis]BAT58092.1 bifunctional aldehyde dehydrogenase/enoyl-CoA hydratase [Variibacter gotjawalensis]